MGADLQYTLGLDAGSFASAAARAVSVMGSLQLACDLLNRSVGFMTAGFREAADMESITAGIDTITKAAAKTVQVMTDLKKLGAQTPFELKDLAPAAKQLLGAGTAIKDLPKQLRVLGDIASGSGGDLMALVTVFNQVRGAGKLMTQDFMQLVSQGVPGLRQEIAKFKNIDVSQVAKALELGAISAQDLEAIFVRMTSRGGVFFNAMAKQSETMNGKLSNLADAWNTLLVRFSAPINNALKPIIDDLGNIIGMLTPAFEGVGTQIGRVVTAAREFVLQINAGASGVEALASSFGGLFKDLGALAMVPINAMKAALPSLGQAFIIAMTPMGDWLGEKLEAAANRFMFVLKTGMSEVVGSLPLPGMGKASAALKSQAADSWVAAIRHDYNASQVNFATPLSAAGAWLGDAAQKFGDTIGAGMDKAAKMILGPGNQSAPHVPIAPYTGPIGHSTMIMESIRRPAAERAKDQSSASNAWQQAVQQINQKLDAIAMPLTRLAVV